MAAYAAAAIMNEQIISFTHVEKTGGITLETLLRRHFGLRHLDVMTRHGWRYTAQDLAADLRLHPGLKSISGHWLRPFIDYAPFNDRLVWYTMLREPVSRYISQYQHVVEKRGYNKGFDAYLGDKSQSNWQVNKLAGEWDAEAARQIVNERFCCVGLLEEYNTSLLLFREALRIPGFRVAYGKPRNPARSGAVRREIMNRMDEYKERVHENNALDIELYNHVREHIFPKQVARYGAERMQRDLATEFQTPKSTAREYLNEKANDLVRRTVYRMIVRARARRAQRTGIPYVRK
jgi:hypothetical protein